MDQKIALNAVKQLLDMERGSLNKITELAIFVPQNEAKTLYSAFARNPEDENAITLINQWSGEFMRPAPVFPKNRYRTYNGRTLKATSFNYEPFIRKINETMFEGFEVQLLEDLSSALNFTYSIQNPTDGNLWGEIMSNGTATGLVRDIKVILLFLTMKKRKRHQL